MSKQLSDKLNAAFGDRAAFHVLVDSHWPEIDQALCTADVVRDKHRAAGKRAVQALAGLTFGTNSDRLELEDLPTSDPLCVRCADQEPGSPPMPTECTCGKTVTSDTIATAMSIPAELRNARMMVNRGHGDVSDEPDPLHEAAADEIERLDRELEAREKTIDRLERELAVEREIITHLTQAVEQSPGPATVRAMRDALERCEWWLSTHPEGEAMRDVCRAALS
jgi:hypothetical protein